MKTKTTHTPGAWFISKNNPLFATDILDMRGDLVARVAICEAVNLIAAAPRMKAAIYRLCEVLGVNQIGLTAEQRDALTEIARAHDEAEGR